MKLETIKQSRARVERIEDKIKNTQGILSLLQAELELALRKLKFTEDLQCKIAQKESNVARVRQRRAKKLKDEAAKSDNLK